MLENYLQNNARRIDYKRYLEMGSMIGWGVVEGSSRNASNSRGCTVLFQVPMA